MGRFIAILLIVTLGTGFVAGLRMTKPVMLAIESQYLQEHSMFDLRLVSTIGFDAEDVKAAESCEHVEKARGSVTHDLLTYMDGREIVLRGEMLLNGVNDPELRFGQMPKKGNECLLDADSFPPSMVGQSISLKPYNDEDTLDTFAYDEYVVVGLARSPLYFSADRGTSSLGSGSLSGFMLLSEEGFSFEYYTELYILSDQQLELYSDEYKDFITSLSDTVEPGVKASLDSRYDGYVKEAQQKISDAEEKLRTEKADAEKKLADAKAELDSGEQELLDAERELEDAAAELEGGQAELDAAVAEINAAADELNVAAVELADGQAQLEDAKAELDAGKAELDEAQAQLDDAKAELDAGKAELDAGAEQMQPGFVSWDMAYTEGLNALERGRGELEEKIGDAQKQLDDSKAKLEQGEQEYAAGQTTYEAGLKQYEAGKKQYADGLALYEALKETLSPEELEEAEKQLAEGKQQLEDAEKQLADGKATLEATRAQLDAGWSEYTAGLETMQTEKAKGEAELEAGKAKLEAFLEGKNAYEQGYAEYMQGLEELEAGKQEYEAGEASYEEALAAFEAGQKEYDEGSAQYDDAVAQYEEGVAKLEEGQRAYEEGLAAYEEGRQQWEDGKQEYEDGVRELEEKVAEAEKKIADGKRELSELEEVSLFLLDRDTNPGYYMFQSDSDIVGNVARVFPIFFFLIAALVCSTTMTRMVDEERGQIGTFRALGYRQSDILWKYAIYSGSAAVLGCLIGFFGFGLLFPKVIWIAYQMLYKMDGFVVLYDWWLLVILLAASLACSVGTTYLACRSEMRSTPANIIRPKTPPAGKRILLEKIPFIWKRLPFLHKVSMRNVFRFKKRMFMMILGIAGCTALVATALGIHDSVANICDYQYDDITTYDITVTCKDPIGAADLATLLKGHEEEVESFCSLFSSSGDVKANGMKKSALLIASNDPAFTSEVDLHLNGKTVLFPSDGEIVLTDKLAKQEDIHVGDMVEIAISDVESVTLKVSGIAENYVRSYIYMTGNTYETAFGKPYEPDTVYMTLHEDVDDHQFGASLSEQENVMTVTVISDFRKSVNNMMESLNYVVLLVLMSACGLAFIVLFNLGNINITERVREIATLKVLGFHRNETGQYVFRENVFLAVIGILVGLPLGKLLHTFVMSQIKVDMVSFVTVIKPISYGLTVLLVLVFTLICDLILRAKIEKIQMAESLKSIE